MDSLYSSPRSTIALWTWDNTVERVVEHQATEPIGDVMGIQVKLETRSYTDAIPKGELKLYNELFQNRTTVINRIEGILSLDGKDAYDKPIGMYRNQNNEAYFIVNKRRYWELLYRSQGKWYPKPRKCKSRARMSKKWRNL